MEDRVTEKPISLAAKRWSKNDNPALHKISDMLMVALEKLNSGELKAEHMIIIYGSEGDDWRGSSFGFMQAGTFVPFAQLGMLHGAIRLMDED